MDLSTILGIIAAFGLMIVAMMTGGGVLLFVEPASLVIVGGGTIGATLVHYPFKEFARALAVGKKAFFHRDEPAKETIEQLIRFATKARKEGILALQSVMGEVEDTFFLKGMQMAVDGQEPDELKVMLDREIDYIQERHETGADIFIAMGTYAPAMGMVGTLIGLVQMLQTMDDPSTIGPAMAVALLTTFYGAVAANVVCMPMSGKLKNRSQEEVLRKTLIAEGMRCVLAVENPRIMEQKLHAYIPPKHRESSFGKKD
ncbi:MAG: motility protein A [Desulfuromonas sp.]|uniref:motility protein A n=1 Tax=Desulfuromonas sp. TaxID=892 RepID=UPI000CB26661|nr:MotA/TolQ/ExbB proton channel family protein [Desulfuromonas sp.]PLX84489.1 MAG: motility protein A [Desulfuromonas sp.]